MANALSDSLACFPRVQLADGVTPVEQITVGNALILVKRDDLTAAKYGGNKVRKLEFLLGKAKAEGRSHVISVGFAGSNFCTAAAIYANQCGLTGISMLLPQRAEPYVQDNLLASHAAGAEIHHLPNISRLALLIVRRYLGVLLTTGKAPLWAPAGGSSAEGVLGFVNAAFELADQLDELPSFIYLPMGSMGSAVGLAIGFALLGVDCKIVAARVVDEQFASPDAAEKMASKTLGLLNKKGIHCDESAVQIGQRIEIRNEFYGGEYGLVTAEAATAQKLAAEAGLELDGTYSAKGMAALLADQQAGRLAGQSVLFWNTSSSADMKPLVAGVESADLPKAVQSYFS